jgi:TPR repeat protein
MSDYNQALACASEDAAFASLLRAAHAGCVRAQSLVGLAYHTGRGVAVDLDCAASWYRKAAGGGDSYAIANLGVLSLSGQSAAADEIDAYTWLQSAVGLGQTHLRPLVDLLERRMAGEGDCAAALPSISPQTPAARPCARPVCDHSLCDAA